MADPYSGQQGSYGNYHPPSYSGKNAGQGRIRSDQGASGPQRPSLSRLTTWVLLILTHPARRGVRIHHASITHPALSRQFIPGTLSPRQPARHTAISRPSAISQHSAARQPHAAARLQHAGRRQPARSRPCSQHAAGGQPSRTRAAGGQATGFRGKAQEQSMGFGPNAQGQSIGFGPNSQAQYQAMGTSHSTAAVPGQYANSGQGLGGPTVAGQQPPYQNYPAHLQQIYLSHVQQGAPPPKRQHTDDRVPGSVPVQQSLQIMPPIMNLQGPQGSQAPQGPMQQQQLPAAQPGENVAEWIQT
eukprot:gene11366-17761_t